MGYIDLHVHSTESDGTMTPRQLVGYACEKGLTAFALTDHDTVKGVAPALKTAEGMPVTVIPGVELSCKWNDMEIHLLGYYIDHNNQEFVSVLKEINSMRDERNNKMCALLRKRGVDITVDEMRARYNSTTITRANIAAMLVEKGYCSSTKEAFEKFIGKTCPCYIPRYKMPLAQASDLIKFAGGIPVIAHPVQYRLTDMEYVSLFNFAKTIGIDGVEAIYSTNTFADTVKFQEFAKKFNMFITGGSDFHGANKPDIDMGTGTGSLMVPDTILDNLRRVK